jgi:hypothetical protein
MPSFEMLARSTGWCAGQKSQSIRLCQKYLPDDRRVQLAASIYQTCKGAWGYVLPTDARDRERLRGWCRNTLDLENNYLKLCRRYLLIRLQQGGADEKRQALRILQHNADEDVRRSAAGKRTEESGEHILKG